MYVKFPKKKTKIFDITMGMNPGRKHLLKRFTNARWWWRTHPALRRQRQADLYEIEDSQDCYTEKLCLETNKKRFTNKSKPET